VGVATESADIATFGMGSKIAVGAKGGRAFAKWIWTGKKPPVGRLTSAAKDQLSKQKRLVESLDISLLTSDAAQLADEIHSKVRS
jgi:hypothetical protein